MQLLSFALFCLVNGAVAVIVLLQRGVVTGQGDCAVGMGFEPRPCCSVHAHTLMWYRGRPPSTCCSDFATTLCCQMLFPSFMGINCTYSFTGIICTCCVGRCCVGRCCVGRCCVGRCCVGRCCVGGCCVGRCCVGRMR